MLLRCGSGPCWEAHRSRDPESPCSGAGEGSTWRVRGKCRKLLTRAENLCISTPCFAFKKALWQRLAKRQELVAITCQEALGVEAAFAGRSDRGSGASYWTPFPATAHGSVRVPTLWLALHTPGPSQGDCEDIQSIMAFYSVCTGTPPELLFLHI